MNSSHCTCPDVGFSEDCPWARGPLGDQIIGHVKSCPSSGKPCPCIEGSLSWAYCAAQVALAEERRCG